MAKKKTTKKKATKSTSKAVAVKVEPVQDLVEGNLSSASLAAFANYDHKNFEGVALDITDNKDLFNNDIVVPKIWLIQAMSELRKAKKADEGDFVNSRTEEILLPADGEHLKFIVIKTFKRWQTFKIVHEGNSVKKEFVKSEFMVFGENHDYKYEFTEEGHKFVRRQVISAYVLIGEDAQRGIVKPYILDFAATSKGAGRDLVSDIKVLNAKKLPSYVAWFKLSQVEVKDENDYFVKTVKYGGALPDIMMPFLKDAYDDITSMIDANVIVIDDRDVHDSAMTAASEAQGDVTSEATSMPEARI